MAHDHNIPKVIYSLWCQGQDQAPPIVKICFERWIKLNTDYVFHVLDRRDISKVLHNFPVDIDQIPMQALSDILRTRLLLQNGGIWVDAALLPVSPLSEWLPKVSREGFFAFEKPGPDRPLASWFLATSPGHIIMQQWWAQIQRYWSKPRRLMVDPRDGNPVPADPVCSVSPEEGSSSDEYPYFWFHYLFRFLIESDTDMAAVWSRCQKKSAVPPHKIQRLFAGGKAPSFAQIDCAARDAPVQKLDWRQNYPLEYLREL